MIRLDRSPNSVVVVCSCGWRELTLSIEAAWRIADVHERNVHPDSTQIRDAAIIRRRREALRGTPGRGGDMSR